MARAKASGGISGRSERSISSSFIRSTRSQSLWDCGEVALLFTACRLSHRDHPDVIILFGVDHRNDAAFQDAKRDEALLTVGKTIIFQGDGMAVEEPLGAQEIKAVLPEILRPFGLIPRHPHLKSVTTRRNYVKRKPSGLELAPLK